MHYDYRPAPLAYFITFHTYGTWLPGDERGTVTRDKNVYGTPRRGPCAALERHARGLLRTPPVVLERAERVVVLGGLEEVCRHRGWCLRAAHIRSNHAHVVVSATAIPGRVMGDLKAWATRHVVQAGYRPPGTHLWTRHGSTRHLWEARGVAAACRYVLHEQGVVCPGTVYPAG